MSKIIFIKILISFALIFLNSCNQNSPENTNTRRSTDYQSAAKIDKSSSSSSDTEALSDDDGFYLAVENARASVDKNISLENTILFPDYKAPLLKIKYNGADFVQILRCAASYTMTTLTGIEVKDIQARSSGNPELEWAWAQAIQDNRICRVVGINIVLDEFYDMTAPKGEYYYVLNPCVSKEHSALGREECSYDLALSYSVEVEDDFRKDLREKNIEVSKVEGSLMANVENAMQLAKKIERHLRACENMVAHDQQMLNFKKGLIQFGFLVVGLAIGSFGGPNIAVMVGFMATSMGSQLLFTKALKWPAGIDNECVNPNVVATSRSERKKAGKSDESHMARDQGKYEEEFQVQALSKRLEGMLSPTGPIAADSTRLEGLLEDLKVFDIKILTLDAAFAKAANLGIDINDVETYPNGEAEGAGL